MKNIELFESLKLMAEKPSPWNTYTAEVLWNDDHTSSAMLQSHLDPEAVPASRPHSFIKESADWIASRFNLTEGKQVADFGCGPGLYTRLFHQAGARVTGIDFSNRSIEYARRNATVNHWDIRYIHGNYLERELQGPFDLVTMIYCDFCALNPDQRSSLLRKIRNLLTPDGSFLLDVFTDTAYSERDEVSDYSINQMNGFWSAEEYVGFSRSWKYDDILVVLDKYDIIHPDRRSSIYNWLQYYSEKTLTEEFEANGLEISEWYSDVSGQEFHKESDTFAVVARLSDR